ncbi:deoxyribodipyrimidine photo-lyase [Marinimicrobium sp. ABcell2]|uniref:deoxyribodipyrimidine photo-lyase n=1 Tax=Marinimicrobium sp. ABcell2 TaxID=3069751 RepID=UPI0027B41909|nr:deoxyribodipyrimidine photo-lyase [Marinimicrobium sp. ABcell2]MDQ2077852.1 deoxyribodipyrimidine photo-lyase [Marinimicrobium sp. ABcell2]
MSPKELQSANTLVWFRNNLRVTDNPALYAAAQEPGQTLAVYVLCEEYIGRHQTAPARVDFIRRNLEVLEKDLAKLNISLVLMRVLKAEEIPQALRELAKRNSCSQFFFNGEYPVDELARDRAVVEAMRAEDISCRRYHDRVILPPGTVCNQKGEAYKVFSAFRRRWWERVISSSLEPLGAPSAQAASKISGTSETSLNNLFEGLEQRDLSSHWPAGEAEAHRRLKVFLTDHVEHYHQERDFPAHPGTSQLSPYLAVGAISARQCLHAVLKTQGESEGARTWMSELIWRDFYQHVVVSFPQVCKHRAMQTYTEAFPWRYDEDKLQAWQRGETGIPIIDAAMRQLLETGWMHNRLRMVAAMFFSKNLQLDWRVGEAWFMSQLIDGDFAANNGGWQWCASTGTDAVPYFRVFNPVAQSKRYDPTGKFIRTYVPELRHLSDRQIHEPPPTKGYPAPIVDLKSSRAETIEIFRTLPRSTIPTQQ